MHCKQTITVTGKSCITGERCSPTFSNWASPNRQKLGYFMLPTPSVSINEKNLWSSLIAGAGTRKLAVQEENKRQWSDRCSVSAWSFRWWSATSTMAERASVDSVRQLWGRCAASTLLVIPDEMERRASCLTTRKNIEVCSPRPGEQKSHQTNVGLKSCTHQRESGGGGWLRRLHKNMDGAGRVRGESRKDGGGGLVILIDKSKNDRQWKNCFEWWFKHASTPLS